MADLCIVLGGAQCWENDLNNLLKVLPDNMSFDIAVINDHIGTFDRFPISWMFTLHPEKLNKWVSAKIKLDNVKIVTINKPNLVLDYEVFEYLPSSVLGKSGSSGLFAVYNLIERYGYRKVVACGIPMDKTPNHFRDEKAWRDVGVYYGAWKNPELRKGLQDRFRSMSGWTKGQFTAPDKEWLTK